MPSVPQKEQRRWPDLPDPGSLSRQLSQRHVGILSPKSKLSVGAPQLSNVCSWQIGVIKAIKVDKDKMCP